VPNTNNIIWQIFHVGWLTELMNEERLLRILLNCSFILIKAFHIYDHHILHYCSSFLFIFRCFIKLKYKKYQWFSAVVFANIMTTTIIFIIIIIISSSPSLSFSVEQMFLSIQVHLFGDFQVYLIDAGNFFIF
jgi:hypothetical protein